MIEVTRLNGTNLYVNAEMIEFVEATPDTIISLTDGRKLIVLESPGDIADAVIRYRQQIRQPWTMPDAGESPAGE
ncbi:MAG: flagellar FlbD family protein [Chloroflexi bacterium]|nr:flagellar FlbD family protein [Chloroflexota bacterium]